MLKMIKIINFEIRVVLNWPTLVFLISSISRNYNEKGIPMKNNIQDLKKIVRRDSASLVFFVCLIVLMLVQNSLANINQAKMENMLKLRSDIARTKTEKFEQDINIILGENFISAIIESEREMKNSSIPTNAYKILQALRSEAQESFAKMRLLELKRKPWGRPRYTGADENAFNLVFYGNGSEDLRRKILEPIFLRAAKVNNVDPVLLIAMAKQESRFTGKVYSKKGAIGIMQLMPGTAKEMDVRDPWDIIQNIHGGARYLAVLEKMLIPENMTRFCAEKRPSGKPAHTCANLTWIQTQLKNNKKRELKIKMYNAGIGNLFNGTRLGKENKQYVILVSKFYNNYKKKLFYLDG